MINFLGALTSKKLAFSHRSWDTKSYNTFDITDGFCSSTKTYIRNNKVILIEPSHNVTEAPWITNKARHFFDFLALCDNSQLSKKTDWNNIFLNIRYNSYILNHCNNNKFSLKYFTIVFENLSLEVLSLLLILKQNYSFINLKRLNRINLTNSLEENFQLNVTSSLMRLENYDCCLILSTNSKYEGSKINSNIKARIVKGNFICLVLGSLINYTFPTYYIGSNYFSALSLVEGNNSLCQLMLESKYMISLYNTELFKRTDDNPLSLLSDLNFYSTYNKSFNGLNCLSSSFTENNVHYLSNIENISSIDYNSSKICYFISVNLSNNVSFKKIIEYKLLNYLLSNLISVKTVLDQNYELNSNLKFFSQREDTFSYTHLITTTLFENEETFISTEGLFKRTTKIIKKNPSKSHWQLFRRLFKLLKNKFISFNKKDNNLIFFNLNKYINYKNYFHFQFIASKKLSVLTYTIIQKTNSFFLFNNKLNFKKIKIRIKNTKLIYWLNDFFTGSKDEYSRNSKTLAQISNSFRQTETNFF